MDVEHLREEYQALASRAELFVKALFEEFTELLKQQNIALAVPIEHRVKAWDSIAEKIDRKSLALEELTELPDLVGLRLILLFSRDLEKTHGLISETFTVHSHEDTAKRLDVSQFGYQSFHYVIEPPGSWLSVPSLADFAKLKAEVQTRTLAQHMWAAASHKLQYKQEQSAPVPVRRSINRVSALLEIVDLEFERVLQERESYLGEVDPGETGSTLNVDLIARVLDELLPAENKRPGEEYAELLEDLLQFDISTSGQLRELIEKHKDAIDKLEATYAGSGPGAYFTHCGLARCALNEEFGESWDEWLAQKARRGSQPAAAAATSF